jgi:hypothetical protein
MSAMAYYELLRQGSATDQTRGEGRMLKVRQAQSSLRAPTSLAIAAMTALLVLGVAQGQQSPPPTKLPLPKADPPAKRIVTQGLAKMVTEDPFRAPTQGRA